MSAETTLLLILAGVAVIVAVRWLADRTGLPAAALLTLVGILYAVLPGPNITLSPDLVLTLVLPPLLYSAALDASLGAIRRNLRTVVSLSVLLVLATALLIGVGFELFVSGATLAAGIALGAAVAPPDPVAALSVGRKVGLPPRLITLIQGEGLLNDATALTILTVAISAAGGDPSRPRRPRVSSCSPLSAAWPRAWPWRSASGRSAGCGPTRSPRTRSRWPRRSRRTCSARRCTSREYWPWWSRAW